MNRSAHSPPHHARSSGRGEAPGRGGRDHRANPAAWAQASSRRRHPSWPRWPGSARRRRRWPGPCPDRRGSTGSRGSRCRGRPPRPRAGTPGASRRGRPPGRRRAGAPGGRGPRRRCRPRTAGRRRCPPRRKTWRAGAAASASGLDRRPPRRCPRRPPAPGATRRARSQVMVPGPQPTSSRVRPGSEVAEQVAGRVLRRAPAVGAQHALVVAVGVGDVGHRSSMRPVPSHWQSRSLK